MDGTDAAFLKTLVLAWVTFQPRSQALATALGGRAHFVARGRFWTPRLMLPARYLIDCIETWLVLRRERPDLVVVISPPVFAPLVAWAWCRLNGARMVIDCHTAAFHSRTWGWTLPIHRWLASRVSAITLHTEAATAEVRAWTPRALMLPDDLPESPVVAPVRAPLGAGRTHRVVIAGSLNDEEPVEASIEAARLLPEVEFVFTGDTSTIPAALISAAPPNALFVGWLQYPAFLDALATADVVASFSLSPHIMNRAAFEAIGLGRALVLTDFPGLRSRFGDVALFASNQPRAMADAIRQAIADRPRLEAASVEARTRLRAARESALAQLGVLVRSEPAPARAGSARAASPGRPRTGQRVLVVSEHDYPAHPLLYRNIEALVASGARVDLVCTGNDAASAPKPARSPLRIHRVPIAHRRHSWLRYPVEYGAFFVRAFPTISWWSMRTRYDVVQVDNMPDFLVFTTAVARLRGARVVLCLFELMPELTSVRLGLALGHPLVRVVYWLEWAAIAWSAHVIAVNQACRRALLGRGVAASKVTVVPNTIAFPQALRGRGAHQPVVVTHATLVKRYGVHVAITAFARLHEARPQLRLLVLGAGEELPELKSLAASLGVASKVEFTGFLPWFEAMSRIRECEVGLVPVLADGYSQFMVPMKIYDYVTMGVPAVSSRLRAVEDYFPEHALSYVPPADAAALAGALARLLDDPVEAERQNTAATLAMAPLEWTAVQGAYFEAMGLPAPEPHDEAAVEPGDDASPARVLAEPRAR